MPLSGLERKMRRFKGQNADYDSFSFTATMRPETAETAEASEKNSPQAVLGEIGVVLAIALGMAALIDFALMYLQVRPFI
jgi:hypothetical protein